MNKLEQRLTFLADSPIEHRNSIGKKIMFGIYECTCGVVVERRKADVSRDRIKSCNQCNGHRMSRTRFYRIWKAIKTRCLNPNYGEYNYWGGRGITICPRWLDFDNFHSDLYASYQEHIQIYGEKDTEIDRINTNGHYEIGNVRWVTNQEQANNQRSGLRFRFKGQSRSIPEISRLTGIPAPTLYDRYYGGRLLAE